MFSGVTTQKFCSAFQPACQSFFETFVFKFVMEEMGDTDICRGMKWSSAFITAGTNTTRRCGTDLTRKSSVAVPLAQFILCLFEIIKKYSELMNCQNPSRG